MRKEAYIHYFTPTSNNKVWPGVNLVSVHQKKAKMTRSKGKIMETTFWHWKGFLLLEYHPAGVNTTRDTNEQTLKVLRAPICSKHPVVRDKDIVFLHTNARPLAVCQIKDQLAHFGWEIFGQPQPAYSILVFFID